MESASLQAGPIVLPTDVSVALTASPTSDLQPGQRIEFTVSITNNGPEPVDDLVIRSSPIFNELDVYSVTAECEGDLILTVVDLEDSYYFTFGWFPLTDEWPPIPVGETRTCTLTLDYTAAAPNVFPVTLAFRTT